MEPGEHPLRRRYALEIALGLVLIAVAVYVLLGGGGRAPAAPEVETAPMSGR